MADNTVTAGILANYLHKAGKPGAQTLRVLGQIQPFKEAIESEVGQQLLKDAIGLHETLLFKVADLTATPEETAEYRAVRKIILKWSERIAKYEKNINELLKQ